MFGFLSKEAVIVGAGPAGLGCALSLRRRGVENLLVLERVRVGASFSGWPREMGMITPSFHSNSFLQTDLNAIHPETSPADLHGCEHPSGALSPYTRERVLNAPARYSDGPFGDVERLPSRPGQVGFGHRCRGREPAGCRSGERAHDDGQYWRALSCDRTRAKFRSLPQGRSCAWGVPPFRLVNGLFTRHRQAAGGDNRAPGRSDFSLLLPWRDRLWAGLHRH